MEGIDDGYGMVVTWHKDVAEVPFSLFQFLQGNEVGIILFQTGVNDTTPYDDDIWSQFVDGLDEGLEVALRYVRESSFPEFVCGSWQEKLDVISECQPTPGIFVAVCQGELLQGLGEELVSVWPFFYAIGRFVAQSFLRLDIDRADSFIGRRVFLFDIGTLLVIHAVGMIAIETGTQHQYFLSSYTFLVSGTYEGVEQASVHIIFS